LIGAGYGRDAAAIEFGGETLIVKSDPITFASEIPAQYLVSVNANDIACLGGIPRWMTVVALLPEEITTEIHVEELFRDLKIACDELGISILGGHTEITMGVDRPLLIGTLLGTVGPLGLLTPGLAQIDDDIFMTRWAGIEGTALLARELNGHLTEALGEGLVTSAAKLMRSPGISIVRDANALRGLTGLRAMHDPTEGGVATAIHELAEASSLGAEIFADAVPILPETQAISDYYDLDPFGMLSSGALLIAVDSNFRSTVFQVASDAGIPIAHIGRMIAPEEGVVEINESVRSPLPRYDRDEITRVL
jgi:hydrogenase maturation factor